MIISTFSALVTLSGISSITPFCAVEVAIATPIPFSSRTTELTLSQSIVGSKYSTPSISGNEILNPLISSGAVNKSPVSVNSTVTFSTGVVITGKSVTNPTIY